MVAAAAVAAAAAAWLGGPCATRRLLSAVCVGPTRCSRCVFVCCVPDKEVAPSQVGLSRGVAEAYLPRCVYRGRWARAAEAADVALPSREPGRRVPGRVYTPAGAAPRAAVLYVHGGGWVAGSVRAADGFCRALAARTSCLVLSVEHRRAPDEALFPGAVEDCYDALAALRGPAGAAAGAAGLRVAVCGDSSGGNLAAATARMARDLGGPRVDAQVLLYPLVDPDAPLDAARYRADHMIKRRQVLSFWDMYSGAARDDDGAEPPPDPRTSPYANLLAGSHEGLPPALLLLAGHDCLLPEGRALEAALRGAGVPVESHVWEGRHHGFAALVDLCPEALEALDAIGAFLDDRFK